MSPWHEKVEECANADELLAVSREFLASWPPQALALVPPQGRPTAVKGVDDLAYWHQRLVDCYVSGAASGEGIDQVRRLLHFFAASMQKAAELSGMPPDDEHEAAARLFSERSVPTLFTSAMTGVGEP